MPCRSQEDHELFFLLQLEELKNEIEKRQAKTATKASEEISQLDNPTQGQEGKRQKSVSEFTWVRIVKGKL